MTTVLQLAAAAVLPLADLPAALFPLAVSHAYAESPVHVTDVRCHHWHVKLHLGDT